ncbi:MAG: DUF4139 domain-containing protein [Geminicoccaceae bacterium]|nr:DUF4139 domain-containing protein [Geminicoccaceae bacterium]
MPRLRPLAILALLVPLAAAGRPATSGELRLERVLLSSAGMVLLDHAADVGPRAELELVVPRAQADDLLKSLVVYDSSGSALSVTLSGEAPTADLFRDLPIAERELASPQALLAALRGVPVAVGGPEAVEGRVVAVVPEERREGEARFVRHRLTLATAEGLRSVLLEEAHAIRVLDPALEGVLTTALERLAGARQPAERRVGIHLEGPGDRTVRVAWLAEAPVWKMSYRALLADKEARLQGWAVVDNRSGRDWREVELVLVAGAPVTLRQALSKLVWAERPEVPVPLPEGIRPRVDEGALAAAASAPPRARARAADAPAGQVLYAAPAETFAEVEAAETVEGASATVFRLPGKVSVPDRGTALLPVLDRALPVERIVLVQGDRTPLRPLAAVRVANDGTGTLPAGILTVFALAAGGRAEFLGDAELARLPPGETRLVPYALDARVKLLVGPGREDRITSAKIADGVLTLERVERQVTRYRLEAPPGEGRTLVLEHPKAPGFRLASPPATAEAERFWRLERAIPVGATLELEIVLERPELERLELLDLDSERLAAFFAGREVPEPLRRAMAEIARLKGTLAEAEAERERLEEERAALVAEQERLRANLAAVPAGSDLARRYLASLSRAEDRLDALAAELATARAALARAEAALRAHLRDLVL